MTAVPYGSDSPERRDQGPRQDRLELECRSVATRLRRVCRDMPEDEFMELVRRVATVNIKFSVRRTLLFPDRT